MDEHDLDGAVVIAAILVVMKVLNRLYEPRRRRLNLDTPRAPDLSRSAVNHQYVVGKLQERYGWQKDQAEREVRNFEKDLQKAA